jgi:predicted  nucleic acid-binding Zn-ribbon protein
MGASGPDSAEIETLKNEISAKNDKIEELQQENEALKEKLQKYESGQ